MTDPKVRKSLDRYRKSVRQRASKSISRTVIRGISGAAKLTPLTDPARHNVRVIRNIDYGGTGRAAHRLDIYQPTVHKGPWPVVFYVHGGGFRLLSKDTHWIMGLAFARMGYLVFNVSYRLAPKHPFPAAIQDVCDAYRWLAENAATYGGDLSRLIVAGESAGANLVTSLSVASTYQRPEPWAQQVFDLDMVPDVAVPACGLFQVTNPARFTRRRSMPRWIDLALRDVSSSYLGGVDIVRAGQLDLADPLIMFERGDRPVRPLPAFFIPVGTKDPLLDDTRRLERALKQLDVPCAAAYYPGEIHAFHALVWRKAARRCWRDTFGFIDRHLREPARNRHNPGLRGASLAVAQ